jgi:predicted GNAT family acetyltransferase
MVEHRPQERRFVAEVGSGQAELTYTLPARGVIDLQHTAVPEGARGHGVAEALARAAFDYARANGLRVIPTCPFVRSWLTRHPEERDLIDHSVR